MFWIWIAAVLLFAAVGTVAVPLREKSVEVGRETRGLDLMTAFSDDVASVIPSLRLCGSPRRSCENADRRRGDAQTAGRAGC